MDSLQTIACISFLENSSLGTEVPHNTPGALGSWVQAWTKCVGLEPEGSAVDMVRECLEYGLSQGVDRAFVEETRTLAKTLDLIHVCDGRQITLTKPTEWTWRVKNFEAIKRKIREDRTKEAEFQRRYRAVKKDVMGIQKDIRRCEDWEDKLEYMLWGDVQSLIGSLPKDIQKRCITRLLDEGLLHEGFELWV